MGTRAVVINKCYGGFSVSRKAWTRLRELGEPTALEDNDDTGYDAFCYQIPRDEPRLIQVVRELGDAANGCNAELAVIEIPDDVEWTVEDYDGSEHIAEKHRTWA
jgi:hypothetical protein